MEKKEKRFRRQKARLRRKDEKWDISISLFTLVVGIAVMVFIMLFPGLGGKTAAQEDLYNQAVGVFNELPRESRELIIDVLTEKTKGSWDKDDYAFTEEHMAVRSGAEWLMQSLFLWLVLSGPIFAIYCSFTSEAEFYLADAPLKFRYYWPWLIIMIVGTPALIVSSMRVRRARAEEQMEQQKLKEQKASSS